MDSWIIQEIRRKEKGKRERDKERVIANHKSQTCNYIFIHTTMTHLFLIPLISSSIRRTRLLFMMLPVTFLKENIRLKLWSIVRDKFFNCIVRVFVYFADRKLSRNKPKNLLLNEKVLHFYNLNLWKLFKKLSQFLQFLHISCLEVESFFVIQGNNVRKFRKPYFLIVRNRCFLFHASGVHFIGQSICSVDWSVVREYQTNCIREAISLPKKRKKVSRTGH